MKKILGFLLVFLVVVGLAGGGLVAYGIHQKLQTELPAYSGRATLKGLSTAVSVYRDEYGVPHIFAATMDDAARALGYIHASERMFQMEMQRRAGQGRLAEIIGKDMVSVDKFIRTLGLYSLAQSSFEAMSPEAQGRVKAYAEGVNAWLATHDDTLPLEYALLRAKPEPWQPADSIVWGKLMALQLSKNYRLEVLRGRLAGKLTQEQINDLFPSPSGTSPVTVAPRVIQKSENLKSEKQSGSESQRYSSPLAGEVGRGGATQTNASVLLNSPSPNPSREGRGIPAALSATSVSNVYDQLGKITGLHYAASNEWVISGARTESGKPILANDPHLGLEAPILWYLARIVTPELSLKGATVPGLPVVLLGQNDHVAWGFTTTGSDVQDLFIETIDPQNPENYLVPGGSKAFDVRKEVIHIKGGDDIVLNVRSTRHGPVMSDIDADMAALAGEGKVMAFAFAGLGDRDTSSEALIRVNAAKEAKEIVEALKIYQAPPQNVVYADTTGTVGFINPGLVPVRKKGEGLVPVDGASGEYDWIGYIPFTELPQIENPAAGFVFNANNAVKSFGIGYYLGIDWEEPYRALRIQEFFDSIEKHTLDTSAEMQADHVSIPARSLLTYLLRQKPTDERAVEALALLKDWDGVMDKDKPQPAIFEAWLYQMHRWLEEKTGDNLKGRGILNASAILFILSNRAEKWCDGTKCEAVILKALDEALAMLKSRQGSDMTKWRWGEEHKTLLRHKLYRHVPVLSGMSELSVPSSGDFYTVDRGGGFESDKDYPFARTHGGGYRGIYDLGNPENSRFMITTGQSGHILSPHYGDLVAPWNDVKSITLSGTQEELAGKGAKELVLEP